MTDELRKRMAKHLTALVFEQVDNNGEWLVHQEYTEGLVDAALVDWRNYLSGLEDEGIRA